MHYDEYETRVNIDKPILKDIGSFIQFYPLDRENLREVLHAYSHPPVTAVKCEHPKNLNQFSHNL